MLRATNLLVGIVLLTALPFTATAAGFANCPQFFPGKQPPAAPAKPKLRELCFSEFAVLHNGVTKTPVYVAQRLNAAALRQGKDLKRSDRFYSEARLPRSERAELSDYKGSGLSRGHMAPAGDMSTPEGKAQSFSLANMVPQDSKQNGGPWARIEKDTRRYIERAKGHVFVFTGPIYEGPLATIGQNGVAVPTAVFKLVYDPNSGKSWAHIQENAGTAKVTRPVSYERFVERTGLQLLK